MNITEFDYCFEFSTTFFILFVVRFGFQNKRLTDFIKQYVSAMLNKIKNITAFLYSIQK